MYFLFEKGIKAIVVNGRNGSKTERGKMEINLKKEIEDEVKEG